MRNCFNADKKKMICVVGLVAFILMLNFLTPFVADDFQYMYSFADGQRIHNFFQIFPSLMNHYFNEIGRIVPHFFVQFFLILPKWVFNLANTICFLLLVWLFQTILFPKCRFSAIMWFLTPVLLWQFVPCFGQIFLWEDGSMNYLWSYLFGALFLLPYLELFVLEKVVLNNRKRMVLFSLFALLFGNYSENVSFSTIFISAILLLCVMVRNKSFRDYFGYVVPIVCGAIGYIFILLSPGEASHVGRNSIGIIIKNMISLVEKFYTSQKMLIVLWAVLLVATIYQKRDGKYIWSSVALMAIAIINVVLLGFGSYYAERSLAGGSVFLIWANIVLLQLLRDGESQQGRAGECVALCIGMYFIAGSLLNVWNGTYDIYETNRRNSEREAYIMEQVANGETEITISQIEPATIYCAKYGVADVLTKDQEATWLNRAMANYYGLEMIWGE